MKARVALLAALLAAAVLGCDGERPAWVGPASCLPLNSRPSPGNEQLVGSVLCHVAHAALDPSALPHQTKTLRTGPPLPPRGRRRRGAGRRPRPRRRPPPTSCLWPTRRAACSRTHVPCACGRRAGVGTGAAAAAGGPSCAWCAWRVCSPRAPASRRPAPAPRPPQPEPGNQRRGGIRLQQRHLQLHRGHRLRPLRAGLPERAGAGQLRRQAADQHVRAEPGAGGDLRRHLRHHRHQLPGQHGGPAAAVPLLAGPHRRRRLQRCGWASSRVCQRISSPPRACQAARPPAGQPRRQRHRLPPGPHARRLLLPGTPPPTEQATRACLRGTRCMCATCCPPSR